MAWVLDLPGCTTQASTQEEAIAQSVDAIAAYRLWLSMHGDGMGPLFEMAPISVEVEQVVSVPTLDGTGNSTAFFDSERVPLKSNEVDEGLRLLAHSRNDLMALVRHLPNEALDQPIEGEVRGSIAAILEHVAWAEWWYCDRLGVAFERDQMPDSSIAKLDTVRYWTRIQLQELAGDRRIVEQMGELWSPRKLLRRAMWHERDHTDHIARLLNGEAGGGGYVEL